MIPVYLAGNLHCFGMCGPLVMLLANHPFRYLYFLGRIVSFTFVGMLSGFLGQVISVFFTYYRIPELLSVSFGLVMFFLGLGAIFHVQVLSYFPWHKHLNKKVAQIQALVSQNNPWAAFLFGLITVTLPCGQSLIVFSACALTASGFEGAFHALIFTLLTSPALFFALHVPLFFRRLRGFHHLVMGTFACIAGALSFLRGLAQMGYIDHWVIHEAYHIVLY